jgi:hypothetical protein
MGKYDAMVGESTETGKPPLVDLYTVYHSLNRFDAENFPQIQDTDNLIGLNSTVPAPLSWLINHNTNAGNVDDGVLKGLNIKASA